MPKDDTYYLHQTPPELCLRLIEYMDIDREDTCYEPFKGEGAFYNALRKKSLRVDWCEIEEGLDYKDNCAIYSHIATNPPFQEKGSFWKILNRLTDQCEKSIGLLGNQYCFTSLTPKRLKLIENKGFYLTKIIICNIKKWYGKYFFMIFTRAKNPNIDYLEGSF